MMSREDPRQHDPHTVYRAYDQDRNLLYIGMTHDIDKRMQYYDQSPKWRENVQLVTFKLYPNRKAALLAENYSIIREHPAWNVHTW